MILELNKPYALNLGEDFKFTGNYYKGKLQGKIKTENLRPMFKGVNSGDEIILLLEPYNDFLGNRISLISSIDYKYEPIYKRIKNGVYNYYFLNNDVSLVEGFFTLWKNSNPLIHIGNKTHQKMNKISNYTYAYKFNNKTF